jgi:dTDP-4-amino-4,6-dideoxygalactose transaminase
MDEIGADARAVFPMILQNDFKRQWKVVQRAAVEAVQRVGASGSYILGEEVGRFEKALAQVWGVAHAVGVANGMDAIEIGLRCLNLRPGDKVLTTPLSAFATTLAVIRAGGVPIFVDVDSLGRIDLGQCRDLLRRNRSIRFLVPVHLYGFPLDLPDLVSLRDEFDLRIVEDCAQAIGASSSGLAVGTVGQVAATSFYPTKNLGAMGDAGALLTNDPQIAARATILRNYGQSGPYLHSEPGLNSRLDELHAAILHDAFLPNLKKWNQARRRTADAYLNEIKHSAIELPSASANLNCAWHIFPARITPGSRDSFRQYLSVMNIATGVHYPCIIPDQQALADPGLREMDVEPLEARRWTEGEVSLPIHPMLDTGEVRAVIDACNAWKCAPTKSQKSGKLQRQKLA